MELPETANYVEFVLKNADLYTIKNNMKKFLKFKGCVKQFKVQKNKKMVMENYEHKIIKVYNLNFLKEESFENIKVIYFEKEKQHYHAFSCSKVLDCEYFVRRVTFRVNNNIYVNFDTEYYDQGKEVKNKIFINYNHEKQQDIDFIKCKIDQTIRLLTL